MIDTCVASLALFGIATPDVDEIQWESPNIMSSTEVRVNP